jgi:HAD superfamily hydrolase (TIGR01549 family)
MTADSYCFAAAIFDFDGTLVDTLEMHFKGYQQAFARYGLELSREVFFANIGGNARETIPKLLAGRQCPVGNDQLHHEKKDLVNEFFRTEPIRVLETAKLLPVFVERMPLALVSSGSRPGIEILLDRLRWTDYFTTVITGEDAQNGKPSPDLFLLAAERLDVAPSRCMVFEDTDAGVQGAIAAGMHPFDVRRVSPQGGGGA